MALTMTCPECSQKLEAVSEEALRESFMVHMVDDHPSIELSEEEVEAIVRESREGGGLIRLSDAGIALQDPEHDTRGCEVFDSDGDHFGTVEELYVDARERMARFLEVRAGGAINAGDRCFLIPVEAVSEASVDRVMLSHSCEDILQSPEIPAARDLLLKHQRELRRHYGYGAYTD